jgi:hypothetical protein
MKYALLAGLLLIPSVADAEESSFTFHERATLTIESPKGEVTLVAVGSMEVFRDKIEVTRDVGRLVVSDLYTKSYDPPMIFELEPGKFLVCMNCTSIAARTFGITDGKTFDSVRTLADAAPRDVARPAYPEFIPTFHIIRVPPDFELITYHGQFVPARYFAPGTRLKSFTVEITDAPVTDSGVDESMPWLCAQIGKLQDQRTDGDSKGEIAVRRALNALRDLSSGECV